jgi:hypothetical protein
MPLSLRIPPEKEKMIKIAKSWKCKTGQANCGLTEQIKN